MKGKNAKSTPLLSFISLNIATDTLLISHKPTHTIQHISVDSFHQLHEITQSHHDKEIMLMCEEENIAQMRTSWLCFLEE